MFESRVEIYLTTLIAGQLVSAAFLWRAFCSVARLRRGLAVERAERHRERHARQAELEDVSARLTRLEGWTARSAAGRRLAAIRRSEAIAQVRRGVTPADVARTLGLSPPEVALLLSAERLSGEVAERRGVERAPNKAANGARRQAA